MLALFLTAALLRIPVAARAAEGAPWPDGWTWQGWPGAPGGHAGVEALGQAVDGSVWIRLAPSVGEDEPWAAALSPSGGTVVRPAPLRSLVASNLAWIRKLGDVEGFWSVDGGGRVWVGPAYHDGRRWTVLAKDGNLGGASLDYGWETLIDGRGNVWVPFRLRREGCSDPADCIDDGLQAFGPEGPRQLALDLAPSAAAEALGARRYTLLSWGREAWALSPGAALRPPLAQPLGYPLLGTPQPGELRNAGYASAAWRGPKGGPQVALWVELQEPAGVREVHVLAAWDAAAAAWDQEALADCPLLGAPRREPRLTAGAHGALSGSPALWLGSNRGEVALRWGAAWWHWDAAAIGLSAAPIRSMLVDAAGGLWLGGPAGLARFGPAAVVGPGGLLYLPGLRR